MKPSCRASGDSKAGAPGPGLDWPVAVRAGVRRALEHVPAERIILAPDCGMKYLTREAAFGKLSNMAEAARQLRDEYTG